MTLSGSRGRYRAPADLDISSGRYVATTAKTTRRFDAPRSRKVIMIHGFNTPEDEGIDAMHELRELLKSAYEPLAEDVFTSTWSGHVPGFFGRLAYPKLISHARMSARPFLRAICDNCVASVPEELVLIAHSLGCRMVLESLRLWVRLPPRHPLPRLTVILMAAAVPVKMVEKGRLAAASAAADNVLVLHSKLDEALGLVFRTGQTLAGEGLFPGAVGVDGKPFPPSMRWDMYPLKHNDYWRSASVAEAICKIMGVPMMASAFARSTRVAPPLFFAPFGLAPLLPML